MDKPTPIKYSDFSGFKCGDWTALNYSHFVISKSRSKLIYWDCLCKCGRTDKIEILQLVRNRSQSCRSCVSSNIFKTHGATLKRKETPEHRAWKYMRTRCNNPNTKDYANYGGRGVTVCERWGSFPNFLADMGEKTDPKLTLDRINSYGNYEPSNCRWATRSEQCSNQRRYKPELASTDLPTYQRVLEQLKEIVR